MSQFESEFGPCLELVYGSSVPPPEFEPVRFYGQWLAERNLGLVPVARPATFAWPGYWLARVRAENGDHAVLMYGSPSGPVHDPAAALAAGGTIEEGWLLARLDLRLPIEEPYGHDRSTGSVAAILLAADAEGPLARVEAAQAIAGSGLEGDRYFAGRGTFSNPGGRGYQLTLVEAEVLDSVDLPWEQGRRNIVTRGVDLNALVGRRFTVGEVECIGRRLAEPCVHLEKLTRPGLMRPLVHRAGLRADILTSGTITLGDAVAELESR
jgi:hypothetical protein